MVEGSPTQTSNKRDYTSGTAASRAKAVEKPTDITTSNGTTNHTSNGTNNKVGTG